jgi:hypothetical protein
MTDDLVAFVQARVDEDGQVAQRAAETVGDDEWQQHGRDITTVADPDRYVAGAIAVEVIDHIVRHDPARALRRVEATQLLLGSVDNDLLPLLALPYADHPDYRPEWALAE